LHPLLANADIMRSEIEFSLKKTMNASDFSALVI